MFDKVEDFNKRVIGIDRNCGPISDESEFEWCIGTLQEEIKEWREARKNKDFIGEIDSVIDIIYFSCGFLTRMGISHDKCAKMFSAVHDANMAKKLGTKDREITHSLDAIKPVGWCSPEISISKILEGE